MAVTLGADDKKKIYLLGGLLGGLGLIGIFVFLKPFGGGSDTTNAPSSPPPSFTNSVRPLFPGGATNVVAPPNGGIPQFAPPTVPSTGAPTTGSDANLTPQIPGIGRTRNDPFLPVMVPALPPAKIPTTIIQEPVPLSLPNYQPPSLGSSNDLPLTAFAPGTPITSTTLYLPPAMIFSGSQRTQPQPLPEIGGINVGAPGAQTQATNASGKRVAGVILGDSIRALIEYQENGQTVSKVVQPGDEVGGMKILSIQRVREGDNSVVRVTVRENGQEEFFDLGPGS